MRRLALCLLLFACREQEKAALMASGKEPPLVVHAEKAAEPEELGRIVRMPAREIAVRLGALRAAGTSSLRTASEQLDETIALDVDPKGNWHAMRENSREHGVEAWSSPEELTVKMRYGKPVKRRPEGNEAEHLREDLVGDAAAYYDLVERFVKPEDAGAMQQAGRSAHKVRLSLRGSPGSAPKEAPEWRRKLTLDQLDGSVVADDKTGAPLLVELHARGSYPNGVLEIRMRREIQQIGGVAMITTPQDAIASPTRTRYELEKRELLEGLASDKSNGRR
jgi:hypothetical protein